jgi:hypothetical protein
MTVEGGPKPDFGCGQCWPSTAETAWEARKGLTHVAELIDESHFHVMILACPSCAQRFVSIFTELIDWIDGDDPQYWQLLPLTETEAVDLIRHRDSLAAKELNALGPGRRSLLRDYPKASEPRLFWGIGIFVGPHD